MRTENRNIEKEIFIAEDGTEFDTAEACEKYENKETDRKEYEAAKERVEKLKIDIEAVRTAPEFIPLSVYLGNGGKGGRAIAELKRAYDYYRLNSKEDAYALARVMQETNAADQTAEQILKNSGKMKFPCIAVSSSRYGYGREIGTLAKEFRTIEKYCKAHGYKVSFEHIV